MSTTTDSPPRRVAAGGQTKVRPSGRQGKPIEDADGAPSGKKRPSKKMKIILGVVLLLVLAVAAKMTVLAPSSDPNAKPKPGAIVAMDSMTLNLAGGHYLQVKLAIQTIKGTSEEFDTSKAAAAVIEEFSDRTVADLTGEANRAKAKAELLKKLEAAYPHEVMDVYYTGFAMQ